MPTSSSYNYTTNRDNIINRSLRIVGAIGQGETGDTNAVTEAAMALNDLAKEWEADGMPLWALTTYTLTPVASTSTYSVPGTAVDIVVAPLKIFQVWSHNSSSNSDSPILLLTRQEYNILGAKTTGGAPSQLWYNPPGNMGISNSATGTVTLYPVPDATYVATGTIKFTGHKPFEDFDASTDVPDFPQYFYNALIWGLADQLSYEYGVSYAGRSMITKKADFHKQLALSFGTEEGSFRIQPLPSWDWESY